MVATPFTLRAIWYAEAYGLVYLTFDIIWFYCAPSGKGVIYVILDWDDAPLTAVAYSLVVMLILLPLFVALHYGIFRCVMSQLGEDGSWSVDGVATALSAAARDHLPDAGGRARYRPVTRGRHCLSPAALQTPGSASRTIASFDLTV